MRMSDLGQACAANTFVVEVAYALPSRQQLVSLQVPEGTNALQAVLDSGICQQFEELAALAPEQLVLGIFSQQLGAKGLPSAQEYRLQPHDRVEIYRPLIADPKQVRKQRAAKVRTD